MTRIEITLPPRKSKREERRASARLGWFNWYMDHGRMSRADWSPEWLTRREFRMVSHRRAH